ncbi:MAG: MFS transporter [Clostridia bacterium]
MKQNALALRISGKSRLFYGWVVVLVSSLSVFFSGPGQTFFFSVFIDHYIRDFGWNRSAVSSLYSIATLIAGVGLFLIGKMADKHGSRKMLLVAVALLGAACLWNSFISGLWMLFIGFFIARLFGQGSMTLLPSTIVPRWFFRKRALAFSFIAIGGVAGSAIMPPLNTFLIRTMGWGPTWLFWALLLWCFFLPVVALFLFDRPEELGLQMDNEKQESMEDARDRNTLEQNTSFTLKQAVRTPSFWLILFSQVMSPMISTGIVFHFVSIMGTNGLEATSAALLLSIIAMVSFPTNLLAGIALDRVPVRYAVAFVCLMQCIGLLVVANATTFSTAVVFATVQGISIGVHSVSGAVVWPNYYGMRHLGSIRGLVMALMVVASALGPLPLGLGFDFSGSYRPVLLGLAILPFLGMFTGILGKKPLLQKRDKKEAGHAAAS